LQVRKLFPTIVHFLHMQQACLFRIDSYRNNFWVIFFLHWESIKSTSYETFLILKRVIHVYKKVSNAPYSMTNKKHGQRNKQNCSCRSITQYFLLRSEQENKPDGPSKGTTIDIIN
jgi:hypothetical protein